MNAKAVMIFRISAKLGKKIHLDFDQSLPPNTNPFLDWSAHLFTADRAQYILITNTASLDSMVMYGKGVTKESPFLGDAIAAMGDVMNADRFATVLERVIAPAAHTTALAKRQNRSVIGSMNDLVYQAKFCLSDQELSPYRLSSLLNNVLMSYIDYQPPREAFQRMLQGYPTL